MSRRDPDDWKLCRLNHTVCTARCLALETKYSAGDERAGHQGLQHTSIAHGKVNLFITAVQLLVWDDSSYTLTCAQGAL